MKEFKMSNKPSTDAAQSFEASSIRSPPFAKKSLKDMGYSLEPYGICKSASVTPKINRIQNFITNHLFTDICIIIGNKTFKCHQIVLKYHTNYFDHIWETYVAKNVKKSEKHFSEEHPEYKGYNIFKFQHEKKAIYTDNKNDIPLIAVELPEKEVSALAFDTIYNWMLSEKSLFATQSALFEIYKAAKFLCINSIIEQCFKIFADRSIFSEHTAFELFLQVRKHNVPLVSDIMLSTVSKYFLPLVASKNFTSLDLNDVVKLLKLTTIGVNCEKEVFYSVIVWLNYDWKSRKCHQATLMNCIRFFLLPPWFAFALQHDYHKHIQRIMLTGDVQRRILNVMSYTATCAENEETMKRFQMLTEQLKGPNFRKRIQIFDKKFECHHIGSCPNDHKYSYDRFQDYLKVLKNVGPEYWMNYEVIDDTTEFKCCNEQGRH